MSKTVTVTRALAQVKSLQDRITRATNQPFVSTSTGGKHETGKSIEDVSKQLAANLQSVQGLIAERTKIKTAIVKSNAATDVTIGGVVMTVAQAIERKGSIELEKTLLVHMRHQLNQALAKVERTNVNMQQRLDTMIQTTLGKDRKLDAGDLEALTGPFEKANKGALVDPTDLSKEIEKLEASISAFDEEVDYALSEVNAVTRIDV